MYLHNTLLTITVYNTLPNGIHKKHPRYVGLVSCFQMVPNITEWSPWVEIYKLLSRTRHWLIGHRRNDVLDTSMQTAVCPPRKKWCIILHTKGNKFYDFITTKLFKIIYTKRTRHGIFFLNVLNDFGIWMGCFVLILFYSLLMGGGIFSGRGLRFWAQNMRIFRIVKHWLKWAYM